MEETVMIVILVISLCVLVAFAMCLGFRLQRAETRVELYYKSLYRISQWDAVQVKAKGMGERAKHIAKETISLVSNIT